MKKFFLFLIVILNLSLINCGSYFSSYVSINIPNTPTEKPTAPTPPTTNPKAPPINYDNTLPSDSSEYEAFFKQSLPIPNSKCLVYYNIDDGLSGIGKNYIAITYDANVESTVLSLNNIFFINNQYKKCKGWALQKGGPIALEMGSHIVFPARLGLYGIFEVITP